MMLGYHEFSETIKDVYALPAESFRRHARIARQNAGDMDCISFDDGHISQYSVALPILSQFDLRAMFFVITSRVGTCASKMTWSHLQELHRLGHTVASHTHTHPMLTACRNAALRKELNASRQILEDQLGIEVSSISVPGGRVDRRVLLACCEAGYRRVYTSRAGEYRAVDATTPEVIGRYIVRRAASDQTLASYLAGDPGTLRRLRFEANAKGFAKLLLGDSLYALAWRKAVRSRSFGT